MELIMHFVRFRIFVYRQMRSAQWARHVRQSIHLSVHISVLFNHRTDLNQIWRDGSLGLRPHSLYLTSLCLFVNINMKNALCARHVVCLSTCLFFKLSNPI